MVAVRVINVLELPGEVGHPKCQPERFRPVAQFTKDWNAAPDRRQEMLCGKRAPTDGRAADLTLVAAVVHGLSARDSFAVPE
ncbi:MAG: hypothetical protein F4015_06435 [Acidimicrobiia bacterium]|nr:hypothetical protein [Acidimicrobiia bacterium]